MGFEIYLERSAGAEVTENIPATPNTQYAYLDACKIVNGDLIQVGATDKMSHVFSSLITLPSVLRPTTLLKSDATLKQDTLAIPVQGRDTLLKSPISTANLMINNVACNANASTTAVVIPFTGAANGDLTGGTIYSVDLQQHRRITACTGAANVYTLTLDAPFLQGTTALALTTGNTVNAAPISKGSTGVKFLDSQHLDLSLTGKSGGNNKIEEVNLRDLFVVSSCPYLS